MGRRRLAGGLGGRALRRRRRGKRERRRLYGGGRGDVPLEHGARRATVRRHHREHQRDEQEEPGAPPGGFREQRGGLTASHELLRTGPATQRRQPPALPRLEQNRGGEDQRVEGQENQQQVVHRAGKLPTPRRSAQVAPSPRDRATLHPPARRP